MAWSSRLAFSAPSRASARSRSILFSPVTSRMIFETPISSPEGLRMGESVTETSISRPSLRRRTAS